MKEFLIRNLIFKLSQKYSMTGIPILLYHRIGTEDDCKKPIVCTLIECFEKQVRYLKENNYYFASSQEIVNCIKGQSILPCKSVLLSFDDGYQDNYKYAFPILKRYGARATIFINTHFTGRSVGLRLGKNSLIEVPINKADFIHQFLSWDNIFEMYESGVAEFEPHGHNHINLRSISKEYIKEEILTSKKIIEEKLGEEKQFFSYPYGSYNKLIMDVLKELKFKAAFAVKPGLISPGLNPYILPRTCIDNSFERFVAALSGWYPYLVNARQKLVSNFLQLDEN